MLFDLQTFEKNGYKHISICKKGDRWQQVEKWTKHSLELDRMLSSQHFGYKVSLNNNLFLIVSFQNITAYNHNPLKH